MDEIGRNSIFKEIFFKPCNWSGLSPELKLFLGGGGWVGGLGFRNTIKSGMVGME